jgi:hypothetical protein
MEQTTARVSALQAVQTLVYAARYILSCSVARLPVAG